MSSAIEKLQAALKKASEIPPEVKGFPYLAETLRSAGVTRNVWLLPACQSLYLTADGPVVMQQAPLVVGAAEVPPFDRDALIQALRTDQAGQSTFREFLETSWRAGVVRYEIDLTARTVAYYGFSGEQYVEEYPFVELD